MSAVPRCVQCDSRMDAYGRGGAVCAACLGLAPRKPAIFASWYLDLHPELRLTEVHGDPFLNKRSAA